MPLLDTSHLPDFTIPVIALEWINSQTESTKDLTDVIEATINDLQKSVKQTRCEIDNVREDEGVLEDCGRLCCELRDRLKAVADQHSKEKLAKEFDSIAIFDKADSRAAALSNIIMARKLWDEGVSVIEALEESEPAPENVVFSLQEAYNTLSKVAPIKARENFLENVKDIFLAWYSTRIVLVVQSDSPTEPLLEIKRKYQLLNRLADFNDVIKHFLKEQYKIRIRSVESLPDLFVEVHSTVLANYVYLCEELKWPRAVLDDAPIFISSVFEEILLNEWSYIEQECVSAITESLDKDTSGAHSLQMFLSLKKLIEEIVPQSNDDVAVAECIIKFGERLLYSASQHYTKISSSFLSLYTNLHIGKGSVSSDLDTIGDRLSLLIEGSDYLVKITSETFDGVAILFIVPAFRSMYENLICAFTTFSKLHVETGSLKATDALRMVSLSGRLVSWVERNQLMLKKLYEAFVERGRKSFLLQLLEKEIHCFEKQISAKSEEDICLAKIRAEVRKLNKRFVGKTVELLSQPIVSEMEAAMRDLRQQKSETNKLLTFDIPAFGTTQNDCVTAAGVALLSLAHRLSANSNDSMMALALAAASKIDCVDDVQAWWIEKCANAVQKCFLKGVGDIETLPTSQCKQFAVDYVYLVDVFKDLNTTPTLYFIDLREKFMKLGHITD